MRIENLLDQEFSLLQLKPPSHPPLLTPSPLPPRHVLGFLECFDTILVNENIPKSKHVFSFALHDLLLEDDCQQLAI